MNCHCIVGFLIAASSSLLIGAFLLAWNKRG